MDDDGPSPRGASHVDASPESGLECAPPDNLADYTDWALERSGGWGRFQKSYTFRLNAVWALSGMQTMVQLFTTLPPHRRRICSSQADQCIDDLLPDDDCSALRSAYEYTQPGHSVATDFELVCESSMLAPLLGTLFFLGFFGGCFTLSGLADSRGRRRAYLYSMIILQVGALLSVVAPSYAVFAASRVIVGFGVGGVGLASFVWNTEILGSSARSMLVLVANCFFAVGLMLLSPISFVLPAWRTLLLFLFILGLPIACVQPFLLESPKWLASKQQADKVHQVLCVIAETNGYSRPPAPAGAFGMATKAAAPATGSSADALQQLLSDPRLSTRFYPLCLTWFALSLGYYGLSMNVSNLGMNIYISSAISAVVELPAYVIAYVTIDNPRFGRRGITSGGLLVGGLCCLLGGLLTAHVWPLSVLLFFVGKLAVSISFAVVYMYAAELFPTSVRSRSIGMQSLCSRVGGMLAPMVANLGATSPMLSMFFFGLPCLISGLLLRGLPETLNKPMLDSIDDIPAPSSNSCLSRLFRYNQLEEESARELDDKAPGPQTYGAESGAQQCGGE